MEQLKNVFGLNNLQAKSTETHSDSSIKYNGLEPFSGFGSSQSGGFASKRRSINSSKGIGLGSTSVFGGQDF